MQFFVFTWQLVKAQGLMSADDKCVACSLNPKRDRDRQETKVKAGNG